MTIPAPAATAAGTSATTPTETTVNQAMAVATRRQNDAVHNHIIPMAQSNGSTTASTFRYIHFANATARAIDLPQSDAAVIAALPTGDRAILSLIRQGVSERIPQWAAQVELEGGAKPHNRILKLAKAWATTEVKALRACGTEDVVAKAETLVLADETEVAHV